MQVGTTKIENERQKREKDSEFSERMNAFRPTKRTLLDQGKEGDTNVNKDGRSQERISTCCRCNCWL
jgi:hypothetical protein